MDSTSPSRVAFGRAYGGPGCYIQRRGELARLAMHVNRFGARAFVLVDGFVLDRYGATLAASFAETGLAYENLRFGGECCAEEVARVSAAARASGADVIVAVGGGKTADTAKLAARDIGARLVVAPTIASTDAPCSAVAVRYDAHGVYQESIFLPRNPDLVLVDSAVVAAAPARFLVAGVGDALSTWFEARSNLETKFPNLVASGYPPTAAGVAIAKACHEIVLRDAPAAKAAVERGALTAAVENIIEANTLLSGVGFENCGVSGAHGIHDGLTALAPTHAYLHGEKVAFGVLCLLTLEGRPPAEIEATARFCRDLGLPTRLSDLGLADVSRADVERVAAATLTLDSGIRCSAAALSVESVADAIVALDSYTTRLFAA